MVLGGFTLLLSLLFSLVTHRSWKETCVSFQPVLLGTDMAMEEEGSSKGVCMSIEKLKPQNCLLLPW